MLIGRVDEKTASAVAECDRAERISAKGNGGIAIGTAGAEIIRTGITGQYPGRVGHAAAEVGKGRCQDGAVHRGRADIKNTVLIRTAGRVGEIDIENAE